MSTQNRRKVNLINAFALITFACIPLFATGSPIEFDFEEQEVEIERLIVQSNIENEVEETEEKLSIPLNGEVETQTTVSRCPIFPKCE